jgi:hypothetical protein
LSGVSQTFDQSNDLDLEKTLDRISKHKKKIIELHQNYNSRFFKGHL